MENVAKSFGGVQAITSVSITVMPGEILALLGENGAGKSTLVGMAAGRVEPDAGRIEVRGIDVTGAKPAQISEAGLRLVPQELLNCADMSVLDNVLLGQRPVTWGPFLDRAAARREARRRLDLLGVGNLDLNLPVGSLPVVDQTFVQIARGLGDGAKVFLLDEPTAPMDNDEVDRFLRVLATAASTGASIVYISHRLDEVFKIASRIVVLRDGVLVGEFDPGASTVASVVTAMVGGRELAARMVVDAAAQGDTALACVGLSGEIVSDVSLEVKAGEIRCIYGISGSGREEIGRLIVGANRRSSGEVHLHGAPLPAGSIAAAVRRGLGYVPAERRSQGLMLESTIAANLTLAILRVMAKLGFLAPSTPGRRSMPWIESLKIKASGPNVIVGSLSGGSQQKVLVARWLAASSSVLVLEEPTRGVDIATKAEMYQLLRELAAGGKAVLVITSDIEEATLAAERVTVLHSGRVVATLDTPTQEDIALAAHGMKGSDALVNND
ncbi:sugar ABC transporter ATP-binding protein [soil metagenome]